ncbi:MAG: TolC family protein [bacterium]|nr:TolC family protein [bacterium]
MRRLKLGRIGATLLILILHSATGYAEKISLQDAIDIAVNRSSRGEIIRGTKEVAEQQYYAERIGFLLPKISINGEVPAYSVDESFRFFGNLPTKRMIKTSDFDFSSNIQLNQSLLTGGDLSITANLLRSDAVYPVRGADELILNDISELTSRGFFDFNFTQPLLKPSQAKFDLKNRKDDLELAMLTGQEETAALEKEVAEAYLGLLQLAIEREKATDSYESARLTAEIDSLKHLDGIVAEEDWLASASAMIDAELEKYDIENQYNDKRRVLASLLDLDDPEGIEAEVPVLSEVPDSVKYKSLLSRWQESVTLKKAEYQFSKDKRASDFSASSHGLTGNLEASYSLGRGTVETEGFEDDDIKTNSWGVSVNLTYPIWDGGASSAAVKAARLKTEKSRLELESARKSARAEVANLINSVDVGYRKLQVLQRQIEMSKNRLDIATFRRNDGQISEVDFLLVRVDYHESQRKYVEELKKYIVDKIELEYRYIS